MSRTLRAVPDVPPRAVAYVRVSDEGGRGDALLSPEIQMAAIRDHCARSGYTLVETMEDIDLTGRLWKRRQMEAAIAMVEDGRADVIVVWKVSRVTRNRLDWAIATDRIGSAGGRLESATEPNETNASGRFARGMLAELAAFESDRIGESWQEVHARRIASGRPANGKPRWGYVYDPEQKMHVPDPETGPVLADLYRRYVGGESVYSLVRWLNAAGHRTAPGYHKTGPGPWSDRTLRRMLDSGFGAGMLYVGGEHRRGAHEAVIPESLWEEYRVAREARSVKRGSERSQYVLSGLVRCECGSAMTGGQFGHRRAPKFRCKAGKETGRHEGGYVTMAVVEDEVLAWLRREVAADVEAAASRAQRLAQSTRRTRSEADILARRVSEIDAHLTEATRQLVRGVIPESIYLGLRADLEAERDRLAAAHRAAVVESGRSEGVVQVMADLAAGWDTMPVEVRRGMLRRLIREVRVSRDRVLDESRGRWRHGVEVVPIWAPDAG